MKSTTMVLAALVAAGCAHPHADPIPPAGEAEGLYDFSASVGTFEGQVHLEGSFEVTGDTVLTFLQQGQCIPRTGSPTSLWYWCGTPGLSGVDGLTFGFERARPYLRPVINFRMNVPSGSERVCERYQSTSEGNVCISWSNRTTYKSKRYTVRPTVVPRDGALGG